MPKRIPHIEQQLKQIPRQPGVYLMKNRQGQVIYVGKASVLAHRVRSYFQRHADISPKTRAMVEQIETIETVVTHSELEAFLLESNLIKKYRPRYNILLRDDKNYPMLRLPIHELFPRLEIVRRMTPADKALFFGPYIPSNGLYAMLKLLRTLFPLPNCTLPLDGKAERPCIEFEIKRCLAPCTGHQSQEDYQEMIRGVRLFLEGRNHLLLKQLRQKMNAAAAECAYEEAARLYDQITKLKRAFEHQQIVSPHREDQDVIAFQRTSPLPPIRRDAEAPAFPPVETKTAIEASRRAESPPSNAPMSDSPPLPNSASETSVITVLFVRNGKVLGKKDFFIETGNLLSDEEIVSQFVSRFYSGDRIIPQVLILPRVLSDQALLQQGLSEKRGSSVRLIAPTRGARKQLLDLALENAKSTFLARSQSEQKEEEALSALQSLLHLQNRPNRIEGYDISNIMGTSAVGARIVFEGGRPKKADYRHFRIKTIEGANDFGMLAEVLQRRFAHAEDLPLPDLILIDGGKGQVSAAQAACDSAGVGAIPMIGLAKERSYHPEQVYRPECSAPINLQEGLPATHLLMQVRDEAHRFAISYHRKVRSKKMLRSQLDEIEGIGKKRRLALLRHFGSLVQMREASLEALGKAPSMNRSAAQKLFEAFHPAEKPVSAIEVGI